VTDLDIEHRLRIVERIPEWRWWWLENPPTVSQRVLIAVKELRADLRADRRKKNAHG
jgi:hypothetical protein